ncbi:membrane protein [Prolixibacter bellariivorans]|uniref:Membrane protein n=1 Tax=Prolixibacter bellariivorans TaxID=314319 RepID=A0A5M4AYN9_9BACT|nr:DUF502 domain-containing protein [Prolixibacter bellariivorans]GET33000.1 membrane protein [Prolixibacter bellariivorans]
MKRITTWFLQGLLLIAPLAITIYVIFIVFNFIDGLLRANLDAWFGISLPGLGILIIFAFITLLGMFGKTIIARPLTRFIDKLLERAPLIRVIYSSLRDLFSAFVGKEKKFNQPAMVLINHENQLWKMGFITQETLEQIGRKELVAIYFPHSYNFSGELYMVPTSSVHPIDINPAEAMKFIVSGGITRVNS